MVAYGARMQEKKWWQVVLQGWKVVKGLNICFYFFLKHLYLPCRKQVGVNLYEVGVFKTKCHFLSKALLYSPPLY